MFSAIRNNIGYHNVASLMRHSAEYETTDVIDDIDIRLNGRVASMGASAAQRLSSARSLTTPGADTFHAKFWRKGSDPLPNAPIRPIRAHSKVQRNHQTTHLQD